MTRGRVAGLAAVLVLLVVAVLVGLGRGGTGSGATGPGVVTPAPLTAAQVRARDLAGLAACPAGLTTDLPALRLPCLSGGADVVADRAPGTPLLVNLWGTWCGPCVAEVPVLVQFAQLAGSRVPVVGVATEDTPDSVYAFAKQFGIHYALVRDDDGRVLRRYGTGVPKTLLVMPDGRVAQVHVGQFASLQAVRDAVAGALGVRV